jgi:hypothetical protein
VTEPRRVLIAFDYCADGISWVSTKEEKEAATYGEWSRLTKALYGPPGPPVWSDLLSDQVLDDLKAGWPTPTSPACALVSTGAGKKCPRQRRSVQAAVAACVGWRARREVHRQHAAFQVVVNADERLPEEAPREEDPERGDADLDASAEVIAALVVSWYLIAVAPAGPGRRDDDAGPDIGPVILAASRAAEPPSILLLTPASAGTGWAAQPHVTGLEHEGLPER